MSPTCAMSASWRPRLITIDREGSGSNDSFLEFQLCLCTTVRDRSSWDLACPNVNFPLAGRAANRIELPYVSVTGHLLCRSASNLAEKPSPFRRHCDRLSWYVSFDTHTHQHPYLVSGHGMSSFITPPSFVLHKYIHHLFNLLTCLSSSYCHHTPQSNIRHEEEHTNIASSR